MRYRSGRRVAVVMIVVDSCADCVRPIAYGTGLAERHGNAAHVVVVTVRRPVAGEAFAPEVIPYAEGAAADCSRNLRERLERDVGGLGLSWEVDCRAGSLLREIRAAATAHAADTVVIGSACQGVRGRHRRLGLALTLAGTCPVVLVP